MKFEKEVDENLALFEVLETNGAATRPGDIVEFVGYDDDTGFVGGDHLVRCAQITSCVHLYSNLKFPAGQAWWYATHNVRPLTKLAKQIHEALSIG